MFTALYPEAVVPFRDHTRFYVSSGNNALLERSVISTL
jgi:hypothetical protein